MIADLGQKLSSVEARPRAEDPLTVTATDVGLGVGDVFPASLPTSPVPPHEGRYSDEFVNFMITALGTRANEGRTAPHAVTKVRQHIGNLAVNSPSDEVVEEADKLLSEMLFHEAQQNKRRNKKTTDTRAVYEAEEGPLDAQTKVLWRRSTAATVPASRVQVARRQVKDWKNAIATYQHAAARGDVEAMQVLASSYPGVEGSRNATSLALRSPGFRRTIAACLNFLR